MNQKADLKNFWRVKDCLQLQTILYNTDFDDIYRTVESIDQSIALAMSDRLVADAVFVIGDSSLSPVLNEEKLKKLQEICSVVKLKYDYFGANLGTAAGHNRMGFNADEKVDFIWIQNPDVVVMPRTFNIILDSFKRPGTGQVEALALIASVVLFAYVVLTICTNGTPIIRSAGVFGDFSYGIYLYAFPIEQVFALYFLKMNLGLMIILSFGIALCFGTLLSVDALHSSPSAKQLLWKL